MVVVIVNIIYLDYIIYLKNIIFVLFLFSIFMQQGFPNTNTQIINKLHVT